MRSLAQGLHGQDLFWRDWFLAGDWVLHWSARVHFDGL
jgi:hypothetical protein